MERVGHEPVALYLGTQEETMLRLEYKDLIGEWISSFDEGKYEGMKVYILRSRSHLAVGPKQFTRE